MSKPEVMGEGGKNPAVEFYYALLCFTMRKNQVRQCYRMFLYEHIVNKCHKVSKGQALTLICQTDFTWQ